jgi:hypothetical protein
MIDTCAFALWWCISLVYWHYCLPVKVGASGLLVVTVWLGISNAWEPEEHIINYLKTKTPENWESDTLSTWKPENRKTWNTENSASKRLARAKRSQHDNSTHTQFDPHANMARIYPHWNLRPRYAHTIFFTRPTVQLESNSRRQCKLRMHIALNIWSKNPRRIRNAPKHALPRHPKLLQNSSRL